MKNAIYELIEDGRQDGIIKNQKIVVRNMHKKGYENGIIAEILEVSTKMVQQWLAEMAVAEGNG